MSWLGPLSLTPHGIDRQSVEFPPVVLPSFEGSEPGVASETPLPSPHQVNLGPGLKLPQFASRVIHHGVPVASLADHHAEVPPAYTRSCPDGGMVDGYRAPAHHPLVGRWSPPSPGAASPSLRSVPQGEAGFPLYIYRIKKGNAVSVAVRATVFWEIEFFFSDL